MKKENQEEEKLALEFVKSIHGIFTEPIMRNIDKYLDEQEYSEQDKLHWRKLLMVVIANSILLKSGSTKRQLKEAHKGLLADFDKSKYQ